MRRRYIMFVPAGETPVVSTDHVVITYAWTDNTSATAGGTITITTDYETATSIKLRWANASGVLTNYEPLNYIRPVSIVSGTPATWTAEMVVNGIPESATRLVAVDSTDTTHILGSMDIPANKLWNATTYGNKLYSVGVVSDVHYQYESGDTDWAAACTYFKDQNVSAICISGDLTDTGSQSHLNVWKNARDAQRGTLPVYSCGGNHDVQTSSNLCVTTPSAMRPYFDSDFTGTTGDYYFTKIINGDVYIFLGIFAGQVQRYTNTMFTTEELVWLEAQLEQYRNQRVFLFEHVPPYVVDDDYREFGYASGSYDLDVWGGKSHGESSELADRTLFKALLSRYSNVIWFSGHSHIKTTWQEWFPKLNYDLLNGTSGCKMVHVPSLTVPRDILDEVDDDGIPDTTSAYLYAESEGYIMDVYQNCIRLRARNFISGMFYGGTELVIDTTPVTIAAKTVDIVTAPTLTSISATKTETTYYISDEVDYDDIVVTGTYSDGSTATLDDFDYTTISAVSMTTTGTKTITITVGSLTTTVSITVIAEPEEDDDDDDEEEITGVVTLATLDVDNVSLSKAGVIAASDVSLTSTETTVYSSGNFLAIEIPSTYYGCPLYYRFTDATAYPVNTSSGAGAGLQLTLSDSAKATGSSHSIDARSAEYISNTSSTWTSLDSIAGSPSSSTYKYLTFQVKSASGSTTADSYPKNCDFTIEFGVGE